jgi:hypothetical protein
MHINKLNITEEAVFDYEEDLCLGPLDKRGLKIEIEEYIGRLCGVGRLRSAHYFRARYIDEGSGQMLILFLYKAAEFGSMQVWDLAGICLASEWSEEAEEEGLIRLWLKNKITDLKKGDWVFEQQARAAAQATGEYYSRGSIKGLPRELINAINRGDY